MLGFQGPAQPSPTLGDALNAGYRYLEVRCLGCDTHQTVALDIVRRWVPAQQLRRALLQEVEHAELEAECTGRDAIKMLRERGKPEKGSTMKYQIWYMKPSFLRGIVGSSPDPNNLSASHVHLKDIEADNQEDALSRMRAENWSPNGEALDLLQSKGLQHTTMTIGDVLVDESDAVYLVTGIGFSLLPKHEEPRR